MNVNVNMGNSRMQYPGSPGPGGPPGVMGNNGQQAMCGPMRGPPPMMDQSQGIQMGGPGQQMSGQMMGGHPNGPGMKGPPQGYPMQGHNGPGPQPSPSDPAYAQQFHHFQQQLYATGSNNGRNPMQPNMPNPNAPPNQSFFE